ncbi:hypothetical protein KR032_003272 [Drosophila birchii]|nr:hypothetical protein KR032_003272 [Drosophila birchii]
MSRHPSDRKVYVGDLGNNARKNDLEYVFGAYGSLRSVWIARNPPGFAFVEFESARDAADAVRGLDGRTVCGRRARCGGRGHFARHCRERKARQRRRSNSFSRSRSTSRRRRTRSKSGTRSRSRSAASVSRRSGRSNGRDENGSSVPRYSDHERNGSGAVDSPPPPKRRYDDDDDERVRGSRSRSRSRSASPAVRRGSPPPRRRGDSSASRSVSRD